MECGAISVTFWSGAKGSPSIMKSGWMIVTRSASVLTVE